MEYTGQGKLGVLIVAEAPGADEDELGTQLVGKAGKYLREELSSLGLRLDEDFWKTNTVICRPPDNKTPTDKQLSLCRKNLIDTIEELQPKAIWTLGNVPTKALLKGGLKKISISSLCNRVIPLKEFNTWVLPMFHPSYMIRNKHDANLHGYFRRNLRMAVEFCKENWGLPTLSPFDDIVSLTDPREIKEMIDTIIDTEALTAFDFEGTGIDPEYPGHRITSMAIATKDKSYAFPIDHNESNYTDKEYDIICDAICDYIGNWELKRVAHSVNFDVRFAEWILGAEAGGKFSCTMVASHILDHRSGNNSLKDQAFLRYGIKEYDKAAKKYISAKKGHKFNTMPSMPLAEQLLYVGADARLTMKLYEDQQIELTEGQQRANEFFTKCLVSLRDIQNNGIIIDVKYYNNLLDDLSNQIKTIEDKLQNCEDADRYYRLYGTHFKYTSPKDLKRVLFEMNKVKPVRHTGKGNASVDEEALHRLDYWMCPLIIEVRKLSKLRTTYIKQYIRNAVDGIVHPEFQLHTVTSFRSSCKEPNVQNTPKRKPEAKKMIRSGIITPRGWKVFEIDGVGMEVSTSAMYHKDPGFIKYLTTEGADMHRDNTCDLFLVPPEEGVDMLRFYGKNLWTFAQFYGDYFGSCGKNLWDTCVIEEDMKLKSGIHLFEHLNSMGIEELGELVDGRPTPNSFLDHCKNVEDKMWNERFPVYTQWKKDINDFYNKNGYTESLFGFRYDGYMDRKQVINYLIQGTAFHLLMWVTNKVNRKLNIENWESYLIEEVHDSMVGYAHPDEEVELFQMVKKIWTVDLPNNFDFINVPMNIEIEVSETDGNFANLEEIEI